MILLDCESNSEQTCLESPMKNRQTVSSTHTLAGTLFSQHRGAESKVQLPYIIRVCGTCSRGRC